MQNANDDYVVCEKKGLPGLLVTDYVYAPGSVFCTNDWKWGEETLKIALKNGRCKLVIDDKKSKDLKEKIESMTEEYIDLDPESDEAKKLEVEIKKLEGIKK